MEVIKQNKAENTVPNQNSEQRGRPLFLTMVSIFSFIFLGFYILFNFVALFKSRWISEVNQQYLQDENHINMMTPMGFALGFLLNTAALIGVIMMWKMKRKGYLLFAGSVLILSVQHLFTNGAPVMTTFVNIALLLLFGTFFRRFR